MTRLKKTSEEERKIIHFGTGRAVVKLPRPLEMLREVGMRFFCVLQLKHVSLRVIT